MLADPCAGACMHTELLLTGEPARPFLCRDRPECRAAVRDITVRQHAEEAAMSVVNHVDVVRDGRQALDWLFGEGALRVWSTRALPAVGLLDINLPRVTPRFRGIRREGGLPGHVLAGRQRTAFRGRQPWLNS